MDGQYCITTTTALLNEGPRIFSNENNMVLIVPEVDSIYVLICLFVVKCYLLDNNSCMPKYVHVIKCVFVYM